jgi:phage replication-related protein YjqB (UPF0714/DUF867 family)
MCTTQHPVRVLKAKSAQSDLIANGFHCSADPNGLRAFGLELGDQVRVTRSPGAYALYTVAEVLPERSADVLRLGLTGRQRVGASDRFEGVLDTEITRNAISDQEAEQQSEFVERLDETDSGHKGLLVCAPHGGMIEAYTAEQAERLYALLSGAGRDVSCWRCKGWRAGGGAYERWHIASTEIAPRSFPLLGRIRDRRFHSAVAFHGYDKDYITVGGACPNDLKCAIKTAIGEIKGISCAVHIADPGDAYAGQDPANLVNWLTAGGVGGIQIEQPARVRADFDQEIADAVASVLLRMP